MSWIRVMFLMFFWVNYYFSFLFGVCMSLLWIEREVDWGFEIIYLGVVLVVVDLDMYIFISFGVMCNWGEKIGWIVICKFEWIVGLRYG